MRPRATSRTIGSTQRVLVLYSLELEHGLEALFQALQVQFLQSQGKPRMKLRSYRYALCPYSTACNMHLKLDCLQLLVLVVTLLFQARVLLQALVKTGLELLLFRVGPASCKRSLSVKSSP